MRYTTGGVAHMAAVIEDDLQDRDTGLHKPHVLACRQREYVCSCCGFAALAVPLRDWRIYRQACLPAAA